MLKSLYGQLVFLLHLHNNQAKFNEISLNLQTNESYFDYLIKMGLIIETNYISVIHLCGYQILMLFIIFEVLFPTCKTDWILTSSFLHYLATTL